MEVIKMKKSLNVLGLVITVSILLSAAFPLFAAEQPKEKPSFVGDWKVLIDFDGNQMANLFSIEKKADGSLAPQWGGRGDISNVKLDNNKLSFTRTFRGRDGEEMKSDITVELLENGTIKGTMSSDMGDFDFTGTRLVPKGPSVGKWEFQTTRGETTRISTLTISQNPKGQLEGKWTTQRGENKISDIKFDKGKLSFKRIIDVNNPTRESTFEGEIKGDELIGKFTTERGDQQVTGKRVGKEIVGDWDLTVTSEMGEQNSKLIVYNDLSAMYSTFFGILDINDLKLDGQKLTFSVSFGFGDRTFKMDFAGKATGDKLEGEFTSERGTSKVAGKKVIQNAPAAIKEPETKPTETKKE
jgi:hypothetical protein